jgi:hypothetical protein
MSSALEREKFETEMSEDVESNLCRINFASKPKKYLTLQLSIFLHGLALIKLARETLMNARTRLLP